VRLCCSNTAFESRLIQQGYNSENNSNISIRKRERLHQFARTDQTSVLETHETRNLVKNFMTLWIYFTVERECPLENRQPSGFALRLQQRAKEWLETPLIMRQY
jgi:hypothetical protein